MCVGEEYQQLELVMCPINLPTNVCKLLPENYFSSCQTVEPYVFPLKLWEEGLQIKSEYHWHKTRDAHAVYSPPVYMHVWDVCELHNTPIPN